MGKRKRQDKGTTYGLLTKAFEALVSKTYFL